MDSFNDHPSAETSAAMTTGNALRSVPKRHYLRSWGGHASAAPTQHPSADEAPLVVQRLHVGQAVTLRAKALSVLRIAHGRVWVTVTDVGAYSRVMAGDHFLSRGDSLTLLPGQELVMEPFGRGEKTSAQFNWGPLGAAATVTQAAATPNWRGGVLQPLLDLRHASGLAARAMGRLVLGLGHAAGAEVKRVADYIAMIFVAEYERKSGARSTFDTAYKGSAAPCRLY